MGNNSIRMSRRSVRISSSDGPAEEEDHVLLNVRTYHRPPSLDAAAGLLKTGRNAVLAGGTELLARRDDELEGLIDLAGLGLSGIALSDGCLTVGAMTTLQALAEAPAVAALAGGILARAVRQAAPATIRAAATLGGTLAGEKGGVEIPTVLLALGARVTLATPEPVELALETLLLHKPDVLAGAILTAVTIPLRTGGGGFAFVSRTPADRAICCAAAAGDRVAVGGVAPQPRLVEAPLRLDALPALDDHLATAAYRRQVAQVLVRRALQEQHGEVNP
jgi:carbon-monoxide dehydrogenase medium subunit